MTDWPVPAAPGSDRMRLAALAVQSALAVDGVLALDAGPHAADVTVSGSTVVRGARVTAEPEGRYGIDLGLQARLVPLPALADAVRSRVETAAGRAGLAGRVGAISVTFHDVLDEGPAVRA